MSLEIYCHAMWLEHRIQRIHNLLSHPLLYREALGKEAHEASELRDAHNMFVCNVANVGIPEKWQHVMLAQCIKRDRSLDYLAQATIRLAPALGVEYLEQLGVAIIAFGRVKQSLNKPLRRFFGSWRVQFMPKASKISAI